VATSDEGSIRAAARRLHLSQPQISRALRELEHELGIELLSRGRHGHGVGITAAGEELVAYGREILDRVAAARAAMRRIGERHSTTLRVGIVAGVLSAGELLAPILAAYRGSRPDVDLGIGDLEMSDQLTPLLSGEVDVAIVRLPLEHPDIVVTPIAQEPRIVMAGLAHELADERSVDVDDILGFPMLSLRARPEFCDYWQLNKERGGSNCAPGIAPAGTVGEAQLAVSTQPVIVASLAAMERFAPNPLIRVIPLTGVTPSVIAVAHKRRDTRRAVRDFVENAQATAERHIDLLPGGTLTP
jgi:DNA-binding transcriptional LysR family regulator